MKHLTCPPIGILLLASLSATNTLAVPSGDSVKTARAEETISAEQIEADWFRQDEVRGVVDASGTAVTPAEDAAGACDGIKNGSYGFHTGREDKPWWQIDLGRSGPLDEMFIFNRCDGSAERATGLVVLLSNDAETWERVYQHDGVTFFGWPDKKPLVVPLGGRRARHVRIQLSEDNACLHLDEVEIYPTTNHRNIALRMPTTQSSTSKWSSHPHFVKPPRFPVAQVVERGLSLAANLRRIGADIDHDESTLRAAAEQWHQLPGDASDATRRQLYLQARQDVRNMAFANPLLDFDDLLLVKRVPARFQTALNSRTYTHMSDQYYGWFSRPGGGLCVLEDFKTDTPRLRSLTDELPPGNIIRPDLSYNGKKVLFAYCRYHPGVSELEDKLDKSKIPENAFYHLYEMNLDGTGLRKLTRGKYDDFDGRYLPNGEIVFLSTRRGQYVQCGKSSAMASRDGELPDCYVRCGGDEYRPVAVYTLHVADADGGNLRQISPFEMFEWTPSIGHDGSILYARWDYVDRDAMPYMSLWSTRPDGTNTRAVFGNYTRSPHCIFEARAIPDSQKIIFTASAHHSNTAGSLVLLDPHKGFDGDAAMKRLTPEVPFPEIEAWPETYFVNPYPLSEDHYLVAWSDKPLANPGKEIGAADLGIYLFDSFGNLNLIHRDPTISSMYPIPIRPRPRPPVLGPEADWDGPQEGRILLTDVHKGLEGVPRGTVRALRLVGVPAKDHPVMNAPVMGLTRHDPGKFVIGTVPVESDGSAHFRVASGVPFFVQALDADGMAVQTMRSAIYVQPGEQLTCIGCHEPRNVAPPSVGVAALGREPSRITPGPEGSWPLDFATLLGPVIENHCVRCHKPGTEGADCDLTEAHSYDSLTSYGEPNLKTHVVTRHRQGRSIAGGCVARTSPLAKLLREQHYDVTLKPDEWERLITWMDTYAHRRGSFSEEQEQRLRQLRQRMAAVLAN
ncbi:MAG: discoidin domain-containing protein [Planctomycetes bacterium]|nr:discoidin domain-containing protein [Planctomycetota bacterium]MBL7038565.1 discoidin domain-containing protein [Pirellulaceae bacterium]